MRTASRPLFEGAFQETLVLESVKRHVRATQLPAVVPIRRARLGPVHSIAQWLLHHTDVVVSAAVTTSTAHAHVWAASERLADQHVLPNGRREALPVAA